MGAGGGGHVQSRGAMRSSRRCGASTWSACGLLAGADMPCDARGCLGMRMKLRWWDGRAARATSCAMQSWGRASGPVLRGARARWSSHWDSPPCSWVACAAAKVPTAKQAQEPRAREGSASHGASRGILSGSYTIPCEEFTRVCGCTCTATDFLACAWHDENTVLLKRFSFCERSITYTSQRLSTDRAEDSAHGTIQNGTTNRQGNPINVEMVLHAKHSQSSCVDAQVTKRPTGEDVMH